MIRKIFIPALALCLCLTANAAKKKTQKSQFPVAVTSLKTERMTNPMSIDTPRPRLGWQLTSDKQDVMQTSYHIIVASTKEKADNLEGDLWDATVNSDQSQWIEYAGKELRSNTPCYWRVKVNTTQGESDWSETALWNVGLLNEADWKGRWIGLDKAMPWDVETEHSQLSARYLRTEFKVEKEVRRATLYISGLGMYEAYINGKKVGDQVLAPAPTDYRRTILYNAFDVTSMLAAENAIGVTLGNGRYYTMQQNKKPYKITNFGYPKLRLNLVIEYADGSKQTVSSDDKWRLNPDGAIRSNNEYDGEIYDARKELGNWTTVGYNDTKWMKAERVAIPTGTLRGAMSPNMKVLKTIKPVSVKKHGDSYIVDMGQNMAGWLKTRIEGVNAGDTVSIIFSENINPDGSLNRANFRHAYSTDKYVADGKEEGRWWAPTFVYHGFRYAEIKGMKDVDADDFLGEVISDEMAVTGTFESCDTILNKVYKNAYWGILGNYKGMPVDCPQRDERQPWLGDRARGCFGEAFIFDNNNLYAKWARDIVESQREDGCIPDVAPAFWNYYSDIITWPAALPFSLEMMYNQYGDDKPLRLYYPAVKKWLAHMKYQYKKDGLMPRDKFADWCLPPTDEKTIHCRDPKRVTDGTLIATAYYYQLNKLMERFAKILQKDSEAAEYAAEAAGVKDAFNKNFLTVNRGTSPVPASLMYPDSTFYGNNTATANLLPLVFDMIDDDYVRSEVEKNIIYNIITENKGLMPCGIIGGQWLMHGLTDMGRADIAWLLATNKKYPSWGYMTEKGATTIWELWNGDTADPAMNSANHVMLLGDLIIWYYEDLAGIKCAEGSRAFKKIDMSPAFPEGLDHVKATHDSSYGTIVSDWSRNGGSFEWNVTVPCNTTATLRIPKAFGVKATAGDGIHSAKEQGNDLVIEIGSGSYRFTSEK